MDHVCSGHPDCKICENERLRAMVAELEAKFQAETLAHSEAYRLFYEVRELISKGGTHGPGFHADTKRCNECAMVVKIDAFVNRPANLTAKALAEVVEALQWECSAHSEPNKGVRCACRFCNALAKLDAAKGGSEMVIRLVGGPLSGELHEVSGNILPERMALLSRDGLEKFIYAVDLDKRDIARFLYTFPTGAVPAHEFEISRLKARCERLEKLAAFLACVIKSGEKWTQHCQREFEAALADEKET